MTDFESPPPLPPPVADEPCRAWGFWPTLGWGLLAMMSMIGAQALVAVAFVVGLIVRAKADPAAPPHELAQRLLTDPLMLSVAVMVSLPALLAVLWLSIRVLKGPRFAEYLALRRFEVRQFFLWAAVLSGVLFGGDRLLLWMGDSSGQVFMQQLMGGGEHRALLVVAVAIAGPIGEELLFRGFMFRGIAESRAGWPAAILIPNFFWAAMHVQYSWRTMLVVFAMGLVLGMARRFSGSVTLPLILHFLWNALASYGSIGGDAAQGS